MEKNELFLESTIAQREIVKIILQPIVENTIYYAIKNVDSRSKLFYGEDCGIKGISEIGKGTDVIIMLRLINLQYI